MLKRIINKIKYHLIKEIVLVDSENIGYQIPEEIPKNTLVYLFISDPFIDEKIKNYKNNKHIKLINISNIRKECVTKKYYGFLYCCRTYKFTFLCFKENKNCHLFKR